MQQALDSFPLFHAANITSDISTSHITPMPEAENKRAETFPLREGTVTPLVSQVGHFAVVSFSKEFYPLSCPKKHKLGGWQGKSFLSQEAGRMKAQCTECWQHLGQTVVQWTTTYASTASFHRKEIESKGRDCAVYLSIGFYFLHHFLKDFLFVDQGLR